MDKFLFPVKIGGSCYYFNVSNISAIVPSTDKLGNPMYRVYLSHPVPGVADLLIPETDFNHYLRKRILP